MAHLEGRVQGLRLWNRIYASGKSEVIREDKVTMMMMLKFDLPAHDFRLLDPSFAHPSTILGRDKAIVAAELQREGLSLLDELASKISTSKLERVRQLKSTLVATTRRVQKVRDEIEQLVNDKGKLAEMYLTQKKQKMESTSHGDQSLLGNRLSVSVPVSPVASPRDGRKPEKSFSIESRHEGIRSSESVAKKIELEMLLVTFLVVTDNTFNKLTSLKKYIEDTEYIINIQLDSVRNKLIQFELVMTTVSFVVSIFGMVAGIFGMNFPVQLYHSADAFKWVLTVTGAIGITIFLALCWFLKYKRLP